RLWAFPATEPQEQSNDHSFPARHKAPICAGIAYQPIKRIWPERGKIVTTTKRGDVAGNRRGRRPLPPLQDVPAGGPDVAEERRKIPRTRRRGRGRCVHPDG